MLTHHLQHCRKPWALLLALSTSSLYASSALMRSFFAPSNTASLTPASPKLPCQHSEVTTSP